MALREIDLYPKEKFQHDKPMEAPVLLKIFSIFDKKAQAYAHPFYFHRKGEALRALEDIVADPQSRINRHPADFTLYQVGEWDDLTGQIKSLPVPEFLEEALTYVKNKNPEEVYKNGN